MDDATFFSQPQFLIRYIGAVMEDARQVNGIWYARERGTIHRLGLQKEVKVSREITAADPIRDVLRSLRAE